MITAKLPPSLETDSHNYFFTMLSDRFAPLNERWRKGLEKRFKKTFTPIYVLPFRHAADFEEDYYVVINDGLEKTHREMGRTDIINLIYPEDLNKQFSASVKVHHLLEKLIKKQGTVFVVGFTSVWLDIPNPNVVVLGPDGRIAAKYDDKVEHIKTFQKLGLPTNHSTIYENFDALRTRHEKYPFFLSASYSSGGIESRTIYTAQDLEAYYAGLRPLNQIEPFIASTLIEDIVSAPNTSALVTDLHQTTVVCVSDQILRNNQYMGNIYPTQATPKHLAIMKDITQTVGNYLSEEGFRGLFGLDFLITKSGKCYPIDLNPRRQGGYFCTAMASKLDLIDLELRVIFKEKLPKFSYEDFQVDYCWAHSKLTPYYPNMRIVKELNVGSPFEPFKKLNAAHTALYYPVDHTLLIGNPGFYLTTGSSYEVIKKRLYEETEKTISKSYELYGGGGGL